MAARVGTNALVHIGRAVHKAICERDENEQVALAVGGIVPSNTV
jgi:hypothetical protein